MVGVFKAHVQGLHQLQLHVGADDEAVDHVILGVQGIFGIVGLVEQAAGGGAQIVDILPARAGPRAPDGCWDSGPDCGGRPG